MAKDKLAFLNDDEPKAEEVEAMEPDAPETAEAPEEVEVEAKAEAETGEKPTSEAPPAPPQEDKHVPFAALLDERDKRKSLEAELAEMRKWREEQERKAKEAKAPDPYDDPQGWARHQQVEVQQALFNERLNTSELVARSQYGDDLVSEAQKAFVEAAQRDPTLGAKLMQEANPYGFVVNWHKRNRFLSEIGDDPEKWREAERERIRAELMAQQPTPARPAPSAPAAPPRSLASAPNAGTGASRPARGPGSAFDEIFGG